MSNRLLMIQSVDSPDGTTTWPLYVDEHGAVQQQDFWKGDPTSIAGFVDRLDGGPITLTFADFWSDSQRAVGKYPVLLDAHRMLTVGLAVIERVDVVVDDPPPSPTQDRNGDGESAS